MNDNWIVIPNWSRHQHYKNRHVPWIKLYTELNSREDWRRLTLSQRGLLVSIWIEYERSRGRLRTSTVPGRVGQRDRHGNFEALVQAGFIELSSRPSRARERGTTYPKESASAPTSPNGDVALPLEEEKTLPPADAVARVKALVETVFEK